jgi:hypothetical protein
MMGIRRMRRTNLTIRPCRKTYGRNGLASSIVLRGTSFHRSAEFKFLRFLLCATRCEIHERLRVCTDGTGAVVCSVALSGHIHGLRTLISHLVDAEGFTCRR